MFVFAGHGISIAQSSQTAMWKADDRRLPASRLCHFAFCLPDQIPTQLVFEQFCSAWKDRRVRFLDRRIDRPSSALRLL